MSTGPDDDLATPHDTPPVSTAPWVMPGSYTVRLIAGGKTLTAAAESGDGSAREDADARDLEQQFKLAKSIYDELMKHDRRHARDQRVARTAEGALAQPPVATGRTVHRIRSWMRLPGLKAEGMRGFGRGPAGPPTLGLVRMHSGAAGTLDRERRCGAHRRAGGGIRRPR